MKRITLKTAPGFVALALAQSLLLLSSCGNPFNLEKELDRLLNDPEKQRQVKEDYAALKTLLSQGGNASANAAASIHAFLHDSAK